MDLGKNKSVSMYLAGFQLLVIKLKPNIKLLKIRFHRTKKDRWFDSSPASNHILEKLSGRKNKRHELTLSKDVN